MTTRLAEFRRSGNSLADKTQSFIRWLAPSKVRKLLWFDDSKSLRQASSPYSCVPGWVAWVCSKNEGPRAATGACERFALCSIMPRRS
jgi:hypothetical protein